MKETDNSTVINGFDDFVSKPVSDVYGLTTINHSKRAKMGLTMLHYCVADLVEYCNNKSRPLTYDYIYRKIAVEKEQFLSVAKSLVDLGFLEYSQDKLKVTRKWLDTFMIEEQWFEAFWLVKNQNFWPGSKKDAKANFIKACKFYPPEYLIKCRDYYIKFLNHPTNSYRKPMAATVFLNLQTERFKENWSDQLQRLINPNGKIAIRLEPTFTIEEKEKLFQ
jgi:hypothetical protein